jgi:hypothetical protein
MSIEQNRRVALHTLGVGIAAAWGASETVAVANETPDGALLGTDPSSLGVLMQRLERAPRRRDFKTVPMILNDPAQWDDEALREVMAYQPRTKQVWDNTKIDGPWLNLMRNSLNSQIWSFKHPSFLVVSATHGSAHFALYTQAIWDKYKIANLVGDKFASNTLIEDKVIPLGPGDYEDPKGPFSAGANSIPLLMRRGVVFMSCHNAIWEQAEKLIKEDANPDKLTHEALAAELTNHLIDGVVLTPGAVAVIPELQQVGFHYAT